MLPPRPKTPPTVHRVLVASALAVTGCGGRYHPVPPQVTCNNHSGSCTPEEDAARASVPIVAELVGKVVDQAGKPIVGAKVTVLLKQSVVEPSTTDETGTYVFNQVPIGSRHGGTPRLDEHYVPVRVEAEGFGRGEGSLAEVHEGSNTVPAITLEPATP